MKASMFASWSLNRMIVLIVALGFAGLFADSILEHFNILSSEVTAFIPVVFSAFGILFGLRVAVTWKAVCIRVLRGFLFTAFAVSVLGLYLHIAEESDDEGLTAEQREHEQKEKEKPLLAPLSFAGLALFGLLATGSRRAAEAA
jgi:hypothetical protein